MFRILFVILTGFLVCADAHTLFVYDSERFADWSFFMFFDDSSHLRVIFETLNSNPRVFYLNETSASDRWEYSYANQTDTCQFNTEPFFYLKCSGKSFFEKGLFSCWQICTNVFEKFNYAFAGTECPVECGIEYSRWQLYCVDPIERRKKCSLLLEKQPT